MNGSFPLHRAVWKGDLEGVKALLESGPGLEELEKEDPGGRTPLLLALALRRSEVAQALLEAGASALAEDGDCWSVCQEATAAGDPQLLRRCLHERRLQRAKKTQAATAALLQSLGDTPDFYAEMSWEFSSWLPLVASVCPSDTYKVYKRGASVRVDATLIGFNGANEWQRGRQSFLFRASEAGDSVEAIVLDHDKRTAEIELLLASSPSSSPSSTPLPSEEEVERRLGVPLLSTYIDLASVSFQRATTGLIWKANKEEEINDYPCRVFEASNVRLLTRTRKEHLSSQDRLRLKDEDSATPVKSLLSFVQGSDTPLPSTASKADDDMDPDEYFDPTVKMNRRLGRDREESVKAQTFKATLWLCEDFPLSLEEQIAPIIDLMAVSSPHFQRLKNFIHLQLPSGFPMKIEIPLFHVIKANISFGNVNALARPVEGVSCGQPGLPGEHCIVEPRLFEVPVNYVQRRQVGGSGRNAQASNEEELLLQWAIEQSLAEGDGERMADADFVLPSEAPDDLARVLELSRIEEEERQKRLAEEEEEILRQALQASLNDQ